MAREPGQGKQFRETVRSALGEEDKPEPRRLTSRRVTRGTPSEEISKQIRADYEQLKQGSTFAAPLSIPSPTERERDARIVEQAKRELADEQLRGKVNEIRKRRGLPALPNSRVAGQAEA